MGDCNSLYLSGHRSRGGSAGGRNCNSQELTALFSISLPHILRFGHFILEDTIYLLHMDVFICIHISVYKICKHWRL